MGWSTTGNVFVEARPKGRPDGDPITDYVVEDGADKVLHTAKTQREAIDCQEAGAQAARRASAQPERQEEAGSLALSRVA